MMMQYVPDDLERCPEHPTALVRHTYDADFYVMNGYPAGTGFNHRTVRFECAECRRELHRAPARPEGDER